MNATETALCSTDQAVRRRRVQEKPISPAIAASTPPLTVHTQRDENSGTQSAENVAGSADGDATGAAVSTSPGRLFGTSGASSSP